MLVDWKTTNTDKKTEPWETKKNLKNQGVAKV